MFKGSRRLWSNGADPLLVVCEEAHRYMAADHNVGFAPTRRAISRIAKEGRKYGVFLGLVTQRPAELDSTILSQCSTLFAMRMTNERDQGLAARGFRKAGRRQVPLAPAEAPQLQPQAQPQSQPQPQPAALDPDRFKLLKRPLDPAAPNPLRR